MRILWFSSFFPNSTDPVRGMFNLQQAQALARYAEVRVVSPVQWFPVKLWHGASPQPVPFREEVGGLAAWHPRYVLTPGVARGTYSAQMAAALLPALAHVRREYPFDVLMSTWAFPDLVVGGMASRLWDVPLLAKVHGSDINVQADYPFRRKQIRWAMERAHRVLAVSGALRERLMELGVPDEKIMVHHNGVDRSRFGIQDAAAARRELGIDAPGKHVVYVGFLTHAKALHVLLNAVSQLRAAGRNDFTLHLVGCGPLQEELKAQAAQLGLTAPTPGPADPVRAPVRFHGRRDHDEVPRWMAAADLFCLPSVREGCPNVIIEALASGRPVVSTQVGGIPELVDHRNGLLVPAEDVNALAGALGEALDRTWDAERIAETAARFDWNHSAQALYEAAREALEVGTSVPVPTGGRQAKLT